MDHKVLESAKGFDPYEVIGIIAPGTIVALLVAFEVPVVRSLVQGTGLTVGDFGLFVLLAFVCGHLVQAIGNLSEPLVWAFKGLPTNFVRPANQKLLSPAQRSTLQLRVISMEGEDVDLESVDRAKWRAITLRAYARVRSAGRSARVDVFNRNYGLFRGLVAATALALAWALVAHRGQTSLLLVLVAMLSAAVWRMRRFGYHYARALFQEFIDLDTE